MWYSLLWYVISNNRQYCGNQIKLNLILVQTKITHIAFLVNYSVSDYHCTHPYRWSLHEAYIGKSRLANYYHLICDQYKSIAQNVPLRRHHSIINQCSSVKQKRHLDSERTFSIYEKNTYIPYRTSYLYLCRKKNSRWCFRLKHNLHMKRKEIGLEITCNKEMLSLKVFSFSSLIIWRRQF